MPTFITVALSNNENDSVRNIELAGTGYGEWNSDAIEVLKYKNGGELIQYEVKETKIGESTLGGDKKDTLYMYDGNKLEGKWTASYTNAFDVKNTWTPAKSVYGGESEFTIKKIDENGNAMKGVKFDVNTNQYTTDKNGEIKIEIPSVTNVAEDNLRYDIIETKTLEGYDLIAGKETLNVTSTSKWVSADEKTLTNNYVKEYAFVAKNNPGYAWNDGMYIVTNNRSVAESLTVKKVFSGVSAEALKDITFHINKGEVVGLIGSNGAGKSTLLKVVSGVMKPTKGKVRVNGVISPMIELGAGFDDELTARENIFLNGSILGYQKDFLEGKFDEIVEFSELKDFLDVPIKNFSSGMVAKLAFSIATIVDPEVLIVDEILSVGDIKFQEKSKNKMLELIKGGTTVLYVSHSIDSIKELCTKVIWLEHGKIIEIGDPNKVCAKYYKQQMGKELEEKK